MNYQKIGRLVGTHGVHGQLILSHNVQNYKELLNCKAFMLELNIDSFIPFFIQKIKSTNTNECFVQFEEINNVEAAKQINNTDVYAPPFINFTLKNNNKWLDIIGYTMEDKIEGYLGVISEIKESGLQQLFIVMNENKIIAIPVQDKLIAGVDNVKKCVTLDLPNNYISIFSQNVNIDKDTNLNNSHI